MKYIKLKVSCYSHEYNATIKLKTTNDYSVYESGKETTNNEESKWK